MLNVGLPQENSRRAPFPPVAPCASQPAMTETRIDRRFAALRHEGRPALVTFVMGGDPDHETSLAILRALPAAG